MCGPTLDAQVHSVIDQCRVVEPVPVADQAADDGTEVQQRVPLAAVRGSPILPVFALVKSRFTTVFIRWPAFPCVSTGITDVPTGRF